MLLRYLLGGIIGTATQTFNLIDPQTGYASTSDIQPLTTRSTRDISPINGD